MTIFLVGLGLIVLGMVMSAVGWRMHARELKAVPEALLQWFIDILRDAFPRLTGPNSTNGERIAALGEIIAAIGVVTTIVGVVAWAA